MYGCWRIGMREIGVKVRMRVREREERMKRASQWEGEVRRMGDLGIFFIGSDSPH